MAVKTAVVLGGLVASYLLLLLGYAQNGWQAALVSIALGFAMAVVGFNVPHDACHGAYSSHPRVNRWMALTLDLMGASSYVWSWKHNVAHHSHPNVVGRDVDIDVQPLCRMAPSQPRRPWHQFQHLYVWILYGLLGFKWQFIDDFKDLARGRIGAQRIPRPRGWSLVSFIGGKLFFFTWALVLPLCLHPPAGVAFCFVLATASLGLTSAVTFQLAHVVEEVAFAESEGFQGTSTEWAVHQVRTTADFAPDCRWLTWLLGGLNFQIEHHLFPRLCHLQLGRIAPIVREVCREHGVTYHVHQSAWAALASHVRLMRQLGRADQPT